MKVYGFLTAAFTMMVAMTVAQETHDECIARCQQFFIDCTTQGGTAVFCSGLRDGCLAGCPQ